MKQNKWLEYAYDISNTQFTEESIYKSLVFFWKTIIDKNVENSNNKLNFYIQLKIRQEDKDTVYSISYLNLVNSDDFEHTYAAFLEFYSLKDEFYKTINASHIILSYMFLPLARENRLLLSKFNKPKIKNIVAPVFPVIKGPKTLGFNLPLTMDITKWGNCTFNYDYSKAIVFKEHSQVEYHIKINTNYNYIEYKIKDKIIFSFKDYLLDHHNLDTFKREIRNQTIFYELGERMFKFKNLKTKTISKLKKSLTLNENFITLDIETRNIKGKLIPFCISIYDGINITNFYLDDYNSSIEMLNDAIFSLLRRKYNNYKVYIHNLSNFDGIFLLSVLCKLNKETKPIMRDNKIIEIKFKFGKYTLFFRDSYMLLPSSLSSLTKNFNVEDKEIYPIFFLNDENIKLNYSGLVPSINCFKNITSENYKKYCAMFNNREWNLRAESLKYCNQDVISLHKVILNFANIIFDLVRLDMFKYSTLPSLAFAIFRSNFLNETKIPIILGKHYDFLRQAFTGGNVDVYKPYGRNLISYDIVSLYPYIMRNFELPVGNVTFFEGDIYQHVKNPFGIFKVEITTPDNLNIPFLQKYHKTNKVYKTITPLGKWVGVYTSPELLKAKELGYKVRVIEGYLFEKKLIFKEFVDFFFKIKRDSQKGTPLYLISKLILNSAFGRLGMNPKLEQHKIISNLELDKYFNEFTVTNLIPLDEDVYLISYFLENKIEEIDLEYSNISVPIAAMISGLGRVEMFKYKNIKDNQAYYTDTDSIVLEKKLPESLVGDNLGQMKLEHEIIEGIFLAPKFYCFKTKNGLISKAKGVKNNTLNFNDYLSLLSKNSSLNLKQEKWYKSLEKGEILIKEEDLTLKTTSGKRVLIYDKNNKFIDTKPIKILEEIEKDT